jgi:hypothetical protein
MLTFIKLKWLQLWLLIKNFFKPKTMVVTQQNIDNAIEQANDSKRALYLKIQAELESGREVCKKDLEMYLNLDNAVWLLDSATIFIEQDCIDTNDVWTQINFIQQNSCVLPKKPTAIVNAWNWLITNTGIDILTSSNKRIITT